MDVLAKMVKLFQTWKGLTCLNGLQGPFCSLSSQDSCTPAPGTSQPAPSRRGTFADLIQPRKHNSTKIIC